jgi:hypothetical protein
VRDAAEKALVALGRTGIREALRLLDVGDPFARDSAAEVLQESGYLDRCVTAAALGDVEAERLLVRVRAATDDALVESAVARVAPPDEGAEPDEPDYEPKVAVAL